MPVLLLVDDDIEVLALNKQYLEKEGFTTHTTDSPLKALSLLKTLQPDCMILDIMLPEMDGFTLCEKIRSFSTCPIILLTGKGSEDDKVHGLVSGADDYVMKPYSLRELKARIDALIRRTHDMMPAQQNEQQLIFPPLTIDLLAHKAFYEQEDLQLTNREFELLVFLAQHPNRDITFAELGTLLFGSYQEEDRRIVMVNISRLRKKFSKYFVLDNMIETVWSKGYRFTIKK